MQMTKSGNEINAKGQALNLETIRQRLADSDSKDIWRSLEEVAESEGFNEFLHEEFPRQASLARSLSRRDFLRLMAASLGLAGLTACMPSPVEQIMPYTQAPEGMVPGESQFFATAMELNGFARGLVARSHTGRPVKIEGNPGHPASLGATDVFGQASILDLYDPDRSQTLTSAGRIRTWEAFLTAFNAQLDHQRQAAGGGLRILTGTVTSPTLAAQIDQFLEQFPGARWHQYDPLARDNVRAGTELAYGEILETTYRFDEAHVILSLDADFVLREPGSLRYLREFGSRRAILGDQTDSNRLYVVESSLTNTGAVADHRLPVPPGQVLGFALQLAARLQVFDAQTDLAPLSQESQAFLEALAADLTENASSSMVIAGPQQPPEVHALAHAINHSLGNIGQTVHLTEPVEANPINQFASLAELVNELNAGNVDLLVIFEGNPVYCAPGDIDFASALQNAGMSVYLGMHADETAIRSTWHLPAAHFLERWGDTRAFDGTVTLIQPLIEPLYGGISKHELLAVMLGESEAGGYDIIRGHWQEYAAAQGLSEIEFDRWWREALHQGFIPETTAHDVEASLNGDLAAQINERAREIIQNQNTNGLEIIFEPDPSIWDGTFANNAWLQELPKPISKITWDNAAIFSPSTAQQFGLVNFQVVELHYRQRALRAPVWIQPGQANGAVTLHLGYGRTAGGRVLEGAGFNANHLRTSDAPWFGSGLEVQPTGDRYSLVTTQAHHQMEGRDIIRVQDIQEFRDHPGPSAGHAQEGPPPSLYPEFPYEGHAWGMSINLNACTGCNACVIACQAENNIPVVGKDEVENHREMHWLRIDRYYRGDLDNPQVLLQPMMCVHCEKAPCEPVCPVAATVHSAEGLNEMVYNRCIGTRYCSNNCPYKVRRFNFLQYIEEDIPSLRLLHNPDVTVRSRGVMEKCTYCVQRINKARIQAKKEGRSIRDGEVVTACQAACPTNAIVFGDINDENSRVSQLKNQPHNHKVLGEIGTQPRTSYLDRILNPNPELPRQSET
jgi:MoCo/4Fe-4S cofactor protein with predicted Tat translocation signal